jgi:hypothetical protein
VAETSSSKRSMPDEPSNWSPPLSRRSLLQGAVGAAGAATIIAARPNFAAAASKISQKAVNYQDHPDGSATEERWIVSDGKGYVLCIGYWAIIQERRGRRDYGCGQSDIYSSAAAGASSSPAIRRPVAPKAGNR